MLIATRRLLNLGSGKLLLVASETHKCPPAASSPWGPTLAVGLFLQREPLLRRGEGRAAQQQLLRKTLRRRLEIPSGPCYPVMQMVQFASYMGPAFCKEASRDHDFS